MLEKIQIYLDFHSYILRCSSIINKVLNRRIDLQSSKFEKRVVFSLDSFNIIGIKCFVIRTITSNK